MCTAFPLFKFTRNEVLCLVKRLHHFIFTSNHKVYAYIVKHNYVLGGMLFTVCKGQLHVSAINVGRLQIVQ